MSTFRERYGSSVSGLPYWVRVAVTAVLLAPVAVGVIAVLSPGLGEIRAGGVILAVLAAFPAYVVLPAIWRRTDESVAQDWDQRLLEQKLRAELGEAPEEPLGISDREPPPSRW